MKTKHAALMSLAMAMLIFGTIGIFRKYIELPSSLIAMARGIIGALFLLAVILIGKRTPDRASVKRNFPLLCASGILIGFNWILLFEAYRFTTVSTATLCYYMAPVLVILAAPILFRERMTLKRAICVLLALVGIALVSGLPTGASEGEQNTLGILLGLGAALLYATVVLMNKYIRGISALDKTVIQLGAAGIIMIPYFFLTESLSAITPDPRSLILLLVVAILHTGIAYTLYFASIEQLPAQTVAIFSYVDPVVAILLSAAIFDERMGLGGAVGAILILGATLLHELPVGQKREPKSEAKRQDEP